MNPFLSQVDPIYIIKRDGSKESPYIPISETFTVSSGKVILTEIPDEFNKVIVKDENQIRWSETISQFPQANQFHVDYRNGIVYFNELDNNKKFSFEYKGAGVISFPSSRVYTQKGEETTTVLDRFTGIDTDIQVQKSRVDNLIVSNPQPSEITDLRVDSVGATFAVARDRFASDETKMNKKIDDMVTGMARREMFPDVTYVDLEGMNINTVVLSRTKVALGNIKLV